MTNIRKYLFTVLIFAIVLVAPAMAAVNFTTMPDGSTNISNGTYWITWNPVGPHVVGDTFFINGTTNLSAGTKLDYTYVAIFMQNGQRLTANSADTQRTQP